MNLYITADQIGTPTGGGVVTYNESEALKTVGPCDVWGREQLECQQDPWGWDDACEFKRDYFVLRPKLAHFYSGTFGKTVRRLKQHGTKITYTVAAHDKTISQEEHEKLGIPFAYPHLTEEGLWQRYIEGYRASDVIVCPSSVARETVRAYGREFEDKHIEVIPHGCELPGKTAPLPARFTVGYLGAYGPDKGVRYLLEAWKKLRYQDATLILAGRESTSPYVGELVNYFGGGSIWRVGWVKNVSDFYNQISLYVQPSATEGFGIEVLEAMAHGRPVLCSANAGAQDVAPDECVFEARNSDAIAAKIEQIRNDKNYKHLDQFGQICRILAGYLTWDKIRQKYVNLWRALL